MDEPGAADEPEAWSTPPGLVAISAAAALAFAGFAVLSTDVGARVLAALAAVVLVLLTMFGACARPRLTATSAELAVQGVRTTRRWPWSAVDGVRVLRARRAVFRTSYLEIDVRGPDGSEDLLVLGRFELGADPVDVAAALQRHRARAGRKDA